MLYDSLMIRPIEESRQNVRLAVLPISASDIDSNDVATGSQFSGKVTSGIFSHQSFEHDHPV
jgi:hypothetical protein